MEKTETLQHLSTPQQSTSKSGKATKARIKTSRKSRRAMSAEVPGLHMTKCDHLYDYMLHYNIYTQKWYPVRREDIESYLNGQSKPRGFKELKDLLHSLKKKHAKN